MFSRDAFVWDELDPARRAIIAPSVDALLAQGPGACPRRRWRRSSRGGPRAGRPGPATYRRLDGTAGRSPQGARHRGAHARAGDARAPGVALGLAEGPRRRHRGFRRPRGAVPDAHLVSRGPTCWPSPTTPRAPRLTRRRSRARDDLPPRRRERGCTSRCSHGGRRGERGDRQRAAARRRHRRLQKSLAEGFGLTVAEAMWKARPVVASRIGGIQDQIEDGVSGILLADPRALEPIRRGGARAARRPRAGARDGRRGPRARARTVPGLRSLLDYLALLERLLPTGTGPAVA